MLGVDCKIYIASDTRRHDKCLHHLSLIVYKNKKIYFHIHHLKIDKIHTEIDLSDRILTADAFCGDCHIQ